MTAATITFPDGQQAALSDGRPDGWVGVEALLTTDEVGVVLKASPWTVRKLRRDGALRSVKVGAAHRYDPADIRAYIEEAKR